MKKAMEGVLLTVEEWPTTTLAERVQRLEDVRAIEETIAHYARCVDDCDAEGVAAIFSEEGRLCGPGFPPVCGRAKIARLYGKLLPAISLSTHVVSNVQVCVTAPDAAVAHCVLWAWDGAGEGLSFGDDVAGENQFSFGRYEFAFVRESDGEWRVTAMNIHFAGQTGSAARNGEHRGRPWPPQPAE